jgi:small GTP-binding protein
MNQKRYKCTMIGDYCVGKTSILNAYLGKSIENVQSTLGIDFFTKSILVKGETVMMTLWDTAGAERFHSLTDSYLRDSNLVIIVYDLTQSTSNLSYWMRRVEQHRPQTVGILGNKNDLTTQYSEDLQDILFPWTRQKWNIINGHCSSREATSVKTFFKRCLLSMVKENIKLDESFEIDTSVVKGFKTRTCCS